MHFLGHRQISRLRRASVARSTPVYRGECGRTPCRHLLTFVPIASGWACQASGRMPWVRQVRAGPHAVCLAAIPTPLVPLLCVLPVRPQEEDRIANELRNAKARTETQSVLFGGENTEMADDSGTTGYQGVAPSAQTLSTPNRLATPLIRNGMGATPRGTAPGATPMRTPRDNFRLNQEDGDAAMQLVSQTPRDIRLREQAARSSLRGKLASLPRETASERDRMGARIASRTE